MSTIRRGGFVRRHAFPGGTLLVLGGVLLHLPMFLASRMDHYRMAGMPMGRAMPIGMVLIVAGIALAGWGLLGSHRQPAAARTGEGADATYAALDNAPLRRAHWRLYGILTIGLVIDTMKPATLGFAVPGMRAEYGLSAGEGAMLPFVAITGTVVGSLVWGKVADVYGRRATILFSALVYIATSICGFMPTFQLNLLMCFCMGAAAGGMLPTVYSLMSESIPAARRGWLVVLQSGLGAALGYLVASGAATVFIPHFGWRVLWLLGAPTGALLLGLSRWIPESPRFLLAAGRDDEAAAVMATYGIRQTAPAVRPATPIAAATSIAAEEAGAGRMSALFNAGYRIRTTTLTLYGLGWGVVNWGFITFLPSFLTAAGDGSRSRSVLFLSSALGIPATALAAVLYARWSTKRAMLAYAAATVVVLVAFAALDPERPAATASLLLLTTALLATSGGMIAMLSPYATEMYPTALRASGSGVAAASSKGGGMLGPLLLNWTPHIETLALVSALPVGIAAVVLGVAGTETAGVPLGEVDPARQPAEV